MDSQIEPSELWVLKFSYLLAKGNTTTPFLCFHLCSIDPPPPPPPPPPKKILSIADNQVLLKVYELAHLRKTNIILIFRKVVDQYGL